jgi:pimeloyl-ACP methyl ester carboxylesterase
LEVIYPDRTEEFSEGLAHHFEKAGDKEKAGLYLLFAARKAKSRYAYTTALAYAEKGAASAHGILSAKPTEIGALIVGGEVKSLLGDLDGANTAYDAALALADGSEQKREIANKRHHRGFVVRAGGRVSYYEQGTQGATVVFVEPLAYGIAGFQPVVEHLCQRYRTVTIEERGATASDPLPEHYTFAEHVADAGAVIQSLERGPVIGVGLSRGSTTLMMLASQYPDMFGKLVLIGAAADWLSADDGPSNYDEWGAAFLEDLERRGYEEVLRDFGQEILSETGVEEMREAYVQYALQTPVEAIRAFAMNVPKGNAEEICQAIHIPTLLLHGGDDLDVPIEGARSLLKLLPDADLYVFEGRGHLPIFTATHEFCEVFDKFVQEGH